MVERRCDRGCSSQSGQEIEKMVRSKVHPKDLLPPERSFHHFLMQGPTNIQILNSLRPHWDILCLIHSRRKGGDSELLPWRIHNPKAMSTCLKEDHSLIEHVYSWLTYATCSARAQEIVINSTASGFAYGNSLRGGRCSTALLSSELAEQSLWKVIS